MADETKPLIPSESSTDGFLPSRSYSSPTNINGEDLRHYQERQKERQEQSVWNLALAISACIFGSPIQIGLNTAILNAPEDVIKAFYNQTYTDRHGEHMPSNLLTLLWAITVAFFCIGGMVGGVSAAFFAGKYGRKNTLLGNNLLAILCAVLQGLSKTAKSYEMLIIGRVVGGMYCGLTSAVAPLYLAEISPIHLRGFCGACNQLSITMGVVLGEVLGLDDILGTEELWPILVAFPAVPAVFSFLTLTWCPKSPRYLLVNKGDDEGAKKALQWFRMSEHVSEEMDAMLKERAEHRNSPKFSVKDLFSNQDLRWPLIICIVLQMSQQFSGINAVIYYSTSIFKSAGLHGSTPQYATVGTGVVNVLMTFVSASIMDRAGRRTLHMIGLAGMFAFSVLLVICLSLKSDASWLSYISIVAIVIYIIFFATGPGAIPWFMVAEMFAQGPRTAAVSVSVVVNWFSNFTVGICYPLLQKAITTYSFLPFCVMLLGFFIFTFLFVPETKGKSITEITMIFKDPNSASSANLLVGSDFRYEAIIEPSESESTMYEGSSNKLAEANDGNKRAVNTESDEPTQVAFY